MISTPPPPLFPGKPRKNDALFLWGAMAPKPFVYCYDQDTIEVVHGPACKPAAEIDVTRCAKEGVPIHERRSGGGTVVLSPGMIIIVVVGVRREEEAIQDIFGRIHRALIEIIDPRNTLGIRERGISDLAIGDRKILGSSLYLTKTPFNYYYQSSLMVDSDLSLISKYLRHPPREPDYRNGRDHDAFCTTLRREGLGVNQNDLRCRIEQELPQKLFN